MPPLNFSGLPVMKQKKYIISILIIFFLIISGLILAYKYRVKPAAIEIAETTLPEMPDDQVADQKKSNVKIIHKEKIQNKIKTSDSTASANNEEAEKLRKMRNPFSAHTMTEDEKRFRETALETLPVTNIIIHDTGVVFFWAKPGNVNELEKRNNLMEDLAYLYKDECRYEKPITTVFLISGRPVFSSQYFSDE